MCAVQLVKLYIPVVNVVSSVSAYALCSNRSLLAGTCRLCGIREKNVENKNFKNVKNVKKA